jgi:hypothetical protein
MSEILEKAVADTACVVEELKANHQAKIEAAISDANARLAKADHHRQRFAYDANLGKPQAMAEVAKASAEHTAAETDLLNLQQALRDVMLRIVESEREAGNARRNLAKFEFEILQRKRVENAGEIVETFRNLERLHKIRDELGGQILNLSDALPQSFHGGMSSGFEYAMGGNRLKNALPDFVWRLFFPDGAVYAKEADLAASEARCWGLSPEPEKAKAA